MSDNREIPTSEEVAKAEAAMQDKVQKDQAAKELADKKAAEKAQKDQVELDTKTKTSAQTLVERYRKSYPDNKVFYVTSDMQVFLQSDHNLAILHQKTLKEGVLETIKF